MDSDFTPTHRAAGSGMLAWNQPGAVRVVTAQIAGGAELQALERRDGWALIRSAAGVTAWVDERGLQPLAGTRPRSRWFVATAAVVVLALVAGGALLYVRTRPPENSATINHGVATTTTATAGLLAQAYDTGRIDRPTWLRYRAYSMFGVDALPAEFRTDTPNGDDLALGAELQFGDPLPAGARAELTSLLGRPANRGSVFYGSGPVQTQARMTTGVRLAATAVCDAGNWTSQTSDQHLFKVWTRCTGKYEDRMTGVIAAMDGLWGPMTKLMGNPLPDLDVGSDPASYGGDGYIDIYLVPRDTDVQRSGGTTLRISGIAGAVTVAAAPFVGNRSSGYILLNETAVGAVGFSSTMTHEFFHLLESAHNQKAQFDRVRLDLEENWFTEASSVWAESHFARDTASAQVYARWAVPFLQHPFAIDAQGEQGTPEWRHQYEDVLWLYFMEQERGPDAIGAAWSDASMTNATNGSQGTAAFDIVFPFASHFADFALRNLNDPSLKPAIGKLYQEMDPAFPPTPQSSTPVTPPRSGSMFVKLQNPGDPPATQMPVSVDHLSAGYYDVTFNADVDRVTFNLSGLAANPHMLANLVVLPLSSSPIPRLVNLPVMDQGTQLCDVKKIERAILVVSNGNIKSSSTGTILATGTNAPCAPKLTVTSVSPGSVPENQVSTIVITGSGFTTPGLMIDVTINSAADPGVQCPCSVPPQTILKVVSDTEIDYTAEFSSSAPLGAFDVTVFDDATVGQPLPIQAVCQACLTLTAQQ